LCIAGTGYGAQVLLDGCDWDRRGGRDRRWHVRGCEGLCRRRCGGPRGLGLRGRLSGRLAAVVAAFCPAGGQAGGEGAKAFGEGASFASFGVGFGCAERADVVVGSLGGV